MLEAVEFPAGVSDLNTGLTDVNRNALSHFPEKKKKEIGKQRERIGNRRRRKKKQRSAFIKTPVDV